jgi:hypothetical protein
MGIAFGFPAMKKEAAKNPGPLAYTLHTYITTLAGF